jgi:hypothetical protein
VELDGLNGARGFPIERELGGSFRDLDRDREGDREGERGRDRLVM